MSLSALLIVLVAALLHATWNYWVKKLAGGPELIWMFSTLSVILYAPALCYLLLSGDVKFNVQTVGIICGSGMLHLAYFLTLQLGYRHGELSLVYPIARATGPLLATLFAVVVLGEQISVQVVAGGMCIVVGVLFLSGGLRSRHLSKGPSMLFGLGTGVLIGCYTVWDAYAVSVALIAPLVLDYFANLFRGVALMPYALKRKPALISLWRRHKLSVFGIALLSPLAYILVLYVYTYTPVVYVAPLREVSVLFTVMLGAVLLKESEVASRMTWGVLIVVGIGLLVSG